MRWTWSALSRAAASYARQLRERGVGPGDVCAIMLRHRAELYPLYLAVCSVGGIACILAYPNARLHPEKFKQGLAGMAQHSGLDWLLTERELEGTVRDALTSSTTFREFLFPLEWHVDPSQSVAWPSVEEHAPCLLQHSSGTTGLQKAVVLSHAAVTRHLAIYADAIGCTAADKIVSWLPLYHDMGLIAAFHLALHAGIPLVQLDPFEWVRAPGILWDAVSAERTTLTWLPNFAFNLLAERVHDDDLEPLRIDSMRLFVNCSEPVRDDSHQRFVARYARYGITADRLAASYAMAETTFAVTQTIPGRGPRVVVADRSRLAAGSVVPATGEQAARRCVSSGVPLPGCYLRAVDDAQQVVVDGAVGEIHVSSESLFDGYRNQPERSAEVLRDGWYRTGDYGFRDGGEWFIVGRKKDLIIVAGKNIYPEDIEDVVGSVDGVIAGRVVAFALEHAETGTEQVGVAVETELVATADTKALRSRIVAAGMSIDVTIAKVFLRPPRWLVKSSSGKLSRQANRDRLLNEPDPST